MKTMYQRYGVISNKLLCEDYFRLCFEIGKAGADFQPGQFVMLKAWEGSEPFLMRPFSINAINKDGTAEIVYRCVGKGTKIISRLKPGQSIQALGPLGRGFPIKPSYRRIALLGRGVGAAPLRFLAERGLELGITPYVFLSARSEELFFDRHIYEALGISTYCSSDPKELITERLGELLAQEQLDAAYVCGSKRLMGALYGLGKAYAMDTYVSLEEHMACGVGACLGCVCSVKSETGELSEVRTCKEGPVFPIERVIND